DAPVQACGDTASAAGLMNPAMGGHCSSGPGTAPPPRPPPPPPPGGAPPPGGGGPPRRDVVRGFSR
ncbi:chaplin family protein, partial [Streptomyces xanthochromogenes]|uniref:chaplin family protein n=1 Tax=Streptomyces xanthochromogenes TaxID=67384 RepID=UPI0038138454